MPRSPHETYRLEFRAYRRKFLHPLITAHGRWQWREGVIVRLTDAEGQIGYGESAPTPGFTRETVAEDLTWLRRNGEKVAARVAKHAPSKLAGLGWALSCARAMLKHRLPEPKKTKPLPVAALLPAGRSALAILPQRIAEGYRVFKWKVGVKSPASELLLLEKLLSLMPTASLLRLDANGALTTHDWKIWLEGIKSLGSANRSIEFFEQPGRFRLASPAWAATSPIPVALDESVTGQRAQRNKYLKKWPGPLVVKPSLWGNMDELVRWRAQRDLVYSSVFETSIGLQAFLGLAATDAHAGRRALGLGNLEAFADDGLRLPAHAPGPTLALPKLSADDFLEIWNRLGKTT